MAWARRASLGPVRRHFRRQDRGKIFLDVEGVDQRKAPVPGFELEDSPVGAVFGYGVKGALFA